MYVNKSLIKYSGKIIYKIKANQICLLHFTAYATVPSGGTKVAALYVFSDCLLHYRVSVVQSFLKSWKFIDSLSYLAN